jgi:hypothetical protein
MRYRHRQTLDRLNVLLGGSCIWTPGSVVLALPTDAATSAAAERRSHVLLKFVQTYDDFKGISGRLVVPRSYAWKGDAAAKREIVSRL